MAEKLKIISLGGLNEIGKNLTVYEYGNDIVVVDCGMGFPDDDMYGIDVVIPDVTYLIKNQQKIRGIFITHGHEDHIGALPYVLRSVNAPIYATRMSAGLIKLKLEEHRLLDKTKLVTCEAGAVVKAGKFSVEFIHVNHSIADACGFAIKSPVGMPGRALFSPLIRKVAELGRIAPSRCLQCLRTCNPADTPYCITQALIDAAKGDWENGLFFCGANVGRIDRITTVRELMDELVTEWRNNR